MRRGNDAKLFLSPKGEIMGFSTGADFCAEHEWGSERLMRSLVNARAVTEVQTLEMMSSGELKSIPSFEERRAIKRNLDRIIFAEKGEGDDAYAVIAYSCIQDLDPVWLLSKSCTLSASFFRSGKEALGAWDGDSFGFAVRGEKLARKLKRFSASIHDGHGIFAGSFLKDERAHTPSGVSIVVSNLMRPEHVAAMNASQKEFEQKLAIRMA